LEWHAAPPARYARLRAMLRLDRDLLGQ